MQRLKTTLQGSLVAVVAVVVSSQKPKRHFKPACKGTGPGSAVWVADLGVGAPWACFMAAN